MSSMTKLTAINYLLYKIVRSRYGVMPTYLDSELFKHIPKEKVEVFVRNTSRRDDLSDVKEFVEDNYK